MEISEKIDLSTNAISQYVTGKRKPDYNTVQKLIDFGVSPLFLFYDCGEPFDEELQTYIIDRRSRKLEEDIVAKEKELEVLKNKFNKK